MHKFTSCFAPTIAILVAACFLSLGCDRSDTIAPAKSAAPQTQDLSVVRAVIAEQLKKSPANIRPEQTMRQLGADELDVVEMVMELEDKLDITISDEAIEKATGSGKPSDARNITVQALADVVTSARRQPSATPRQAR